MNKIEEGLHKVHSVARNQTESSTAATATDIVDTTDLEPFLRVNLVSSGSPAELAVRYIYIYSTKYSIKKMTNDRMFWIILNSIGDSS